jgi:hypothetical protein
MGPLLKVNSFFFALQSFTGYVEIQLSERLKDETYLFYTVLSESRCALIKRVESDAYNP